MTRLVIGVGNPLRSDDGAGIEVARRLRRVTARSSPAPGFELMDAWRDADDVVIVDAMSSGLPPGTVRSFDARRSPLPTGAFVSSHSIGVAEVIEVARRLRRLPARLVVYGIEAERLEPGTSLSPRVNGAVAALAEELDHA